MGIETIDEGFDFIFVFSVNGQREIAIAWNAGRRGGQIVWHVFHLMEQDAVVGTKLFVMITKNKSEGNFERGNVINHFLEIVYSRVTENDVPPSE